MEVTVSNRTVLRVLALAALFSVFVSLVYAIRGVLELVLVAGFLAIALNPAVLGVERRLRVRRPVAVLIVFIVALLLLGAFLAALLTPLYNEVQGFADHADQYVADLRGSGLIHDLDVRYDLFNRIEREARTLPERLPANAGSLFGVAGTIFNVVFRAVTVLFLTLFLLLELPAISSSVLSLLSPATGERAAVISREINETVSRYVAGNVLISLIAGFTVFVPLIIFHVPYAVVLGLLMAVFDLIPLVGATIGSVFIVLVAFTQGVGPGVAMIVIVVVYQQFENHVLQPVVMKRSVAVSPFIVIVSVLVGSTLLGILGALLAIPAAGSIQIALREVINARRRAVTTQHVMAGIEPPALP